MRRRVALIVAYGLAAVAISACGSSGGSGSPSKDAKAIKVQNTYGRAAGPVEHLNWALPYGEPNTIDPPNTAYYSSAMVAAQLCDTLLRFNPDFTTAPNLATATQPDPLTVVFDLNKGVKFWNGHEMTSEDVKYSLDRARSPKSVVGFLFTSVKSVEAVGRYQVKVHFKTPDELMLKEMPSFSGMVYEKAYAEKAGADFGSSKGGMMCSGPFKLKLWNPGSSIELEANEN